MPLLKGLETPSGFLEWPDEASRKQACKAGSSPGLFQLAKNPPESWKDGIKLKKSWGSVQPRESLLSLYDASGYDGSDQVISIALKAVKAIPKTGVRDKTSKWTNEWLEDLGINVPTPDDSTQLE